MGSHTGFHHVNSKWIISCKIHESRPFRTFHIWNAKEVNNGTLYQDACSSTEYSIQSMEEITHGTDSINNFVIERTDENGNVSYPKISKHVVALDFAPIALITYQEFADMWQTQWQKRKENSVAPKEEWAYINFVQAFLVHFLDSNRRTIATAWENERQKRRDAVSKVVGFCV